MASLGLGVIMTTLLLNPCPYCLPYVGQANAEPLFVETSTDNIVRGMALECPECGTRSMTVEQGDDETAVKFWNDLTEAIKKFEKGI